MWTKLVQQGIKIGTKATLKKGMQKGLEYSIDEELFGVKEVDKGNDEAIEKLNKDFERVENSDPKDWTVKDVQNAMKRWDYTKNKKIQKKVRKYYELKYPEKSEKPAK